MGRPLKTGLDYFPLDTRWDPKVQLLQAKHGLEGVGFFVTLLQAVYDHGYFLPWDPSSDEVELRYLQLGLSKEEGSRLLEACVARGLFNREKLEQEQVLTSHGIQAQFTEIRAKSRRKCAPLDARYNLLETGVIVAPAVVSSEETPVIVAQAPEMSKKVHKLKERKVKDIREPDMVLGSGDNVPLTAADYGKLCDEYGEATIRGYAEKVSRYQSTSGKTYKGAKGCAAAIRNFMDRDKITKIPPPPPPCEHCGKPIEYGMCRNLDCPQYDRGEDPDNAFAEYHAKEGLGASQPV